MNAMGSYSRQRAMDPQIVSGLITMFNEHNHLTTVFMMARDKFKENNLILVRIRLIGDHKRDTRE